jgi:hypothetical protein
MRRHARNQQAIAPLALGFFKLFSTAVLLMSSFSAITGIAMILSPAINAKIFLFVSHNPTSHFPTPSPKSALLKWSVHENPIHPARLFALVNPAVGLPSEAAKIFAAFFMLFSWMGR